MKTTQWILILAILGTAGCASTSMASRAPANTSGGTPSAELQNWFLKTTEVRLGPVELVEGPESCQLGSLRVIDLGDELTLMLGANPLITKIGKPESVDKERKCVSTQTTSVTQRRLEGLRVQKCTDIEARYHVVVDVLDSGIRYTRRVTSKNQAVLNETCTYKYSR